MLRRFFKLSEAGHYVCQLRSDQPGLYVADAAFRVDIAFIVAAEAATGNAANNIQIHGGIDFSAEAHLLAKRAQLLIALRGSHEPALIAWRGLIMVRPHIHLHPRFLLPHHRNR